MKIKNVYITNKYTPHKTKTYKRTNCNKLYKNKSYTYKNFTNDNYKKYITGKANNCELIRVLYKKVNQIPQVKIISLQKLKKAIVKRNLDIIPYETVYIICMNKKEQYKFGMPINIILDFYNIAGDLILVDIDKNKREFKGLSQEDIIWYTNDLINKSSNFSNYSVKPNKAIIKTREKSYDRDFDNSSTNIQNNFETVLIKLLLNIELSLATLLKGSDNK